MSWGTSWRGSASGIGGSPRRHPSFEYRIIA
jgi:hypothetical protein